MVVQSYSNYEPFVSWSCFLSKTISQNLPRGYLLSPIQILEFKNSYRYLLLSWTIIFPRWLVCLFMYGVFHGNRTRDWTPLVGSLSLKSAMIISNALTQWLVIWMWNDLYHIKPLLCHVCGIGGNIICFFKECCLYSQFNITYNMWSWFQINFHVD